MDSELKTEQIITTMTTIPMGLTSKINTITQQATNLNIISELMETKEITDLMEVTITEVNN